jgi:esterase/lipase superfamily enzyme
MKEEYMKWYSPSLSGEIEMMVYGHSGLPVVIFPTTMGRYYESKDFHLIDSAKWFINQGHVQIFAIDSVDKHSWYNRDIHPRAKVQNHNWYDKMLRDELIEQIRHNTPSGKVAVAGCSFGGFHAANFAFRHPEVVSHLFTMSGAFEAKSFLYGHYDENVYFNTPTDFVPSLNHPDLWNMKIVLGTSEWDICKEANLQMSEILKRKNVPHWLDERPQAKHDWPIWREMFPHYLSLI